VTRGHRQLLSSGKSGDAGVLHFSTTSQSAKVDDDQSPQSRLRFCLAISCSQFVPESCLLHFEVEIGVGMLYFASLLLSTSRSLELSVCCNIAEYIHRQGVAGSCLPMAAMATTAGMPLLSKAHWLADDRTGLNNSRYASSHRDVVDLCGRALHCSLCQTIAMAFGIGSSIN